MRNCKLNLTLGQLKVVDRSVSFQGSKKTKKKTIGFIRDDDDDFIAMLRDTKEGTQQVSQKDINNWNEEYYKKNGIEKPKKPSTRTNRNNTKQNKQGKKNGNQANNNNKKKKKKKKKKKGPQITVI